MSLLLIQVPTVGPSFDFIDDNGVCSSGVRAVFLDIFGNIQAYRLTHIQKVSFYNIDVTTGNILYIHKLSDHCNL